MSVVYDERLEMQSEKEAPPRCLFCGKLAGYPCIIWRGDTVFRICSSCAASQMPGLWSDALELNAMMEIRRIGNRADIVMERMWELRAW